MSDILTDCPIGRGPCPLAVVRQAREIEETYVHCYGCGAELKVGSNGELPACHCRKPQAKEPAPREAAK